MLVNSQVIPQLNTTVIEPLHLLLQNLLGRRSHIEEWFQSQWKLSMPPVYGSVDLRNAGFKLAPIDMNLFPAGFNNLNPNYFSVSVKAAREIIQTIAPNAKQILVVPESHTRNLFYWANVRTLQRILEDAGFTIRFGILAEEIKEPLTIDLPSGEKVVVEPLVREQNKLSVHGFDPDLILLNNDLSEGIPEILQNLDQQIIPPAELGWSQRLKSEHFQYYAEVADEFAQEFNLDAWLLSPLFRHCGKIDFMQQEGMECLIANAEILFEEIKQKYAEYKIPYHPFLIVKADAGTYGMAVMTVRNVDELKNMNRKQRTRMATTKGGQTVDRVIIQEGVYTFETIGAEQAVAEPVVYLWGNSVVGGFYRVHQDRGVDENLNSPGMRFEPIAFPEQCNQPCDKSEATTCQNRLYIYGIVAQLSMLAAAREMKDQTK
jgi:glutamate--cysteine ligase